MERLHLNTVVAALMEWLNALGTWRQKEETPIALETVRTYLLAMAPVAPHVVEELWNHLGGQTSVFEGQMTWPKWEPQYLVEDQIDLIVQVRGKVRDRIRVAAGASRAEVERQVMALEKVTSALAGRAPKRVIYVPGKLVNVVPG